jgi:hypothetical protein
MSNRARSVTADAIAGLDKVHIARQLARRLREVKSTHAWTNEECDLLARLCAVLGVEEGKNG